MEIHQLLLKRLDDHCRSLDLGSTRDIQWSDGQLIRRCAMLAERSDPAAGVIFCPHVNIRTNRNLSFAFIRIFEELGWATYSIAEDCLKLTLPCEFGAIDVATEREVIDFLNPNVVVENETPAPSDQPGKIMYIEEKPGLAGHARIGRVKFSASRRTIYYKGRKIQSLNGSGYKANYFNIESGLEYWISNCKKNATIRSIPESSISMKMPEKSIGPRSANCPKIVT